MAACSVSLLLVLIDELADSRDGVLTLEEELNSGLTLRQVQHRVRTGRWSKLHPGSTSSAGARPTSGQHLGSGGMGGFDSRGERADGGVVVATP